MLECHKIENFDSDYIIGQYYMNLKNLVDNLCDIINIPEMSLFQIIETIKSKNIRSCDPVLISQIIKFKLEKIFKEFECPDCGSKMNHNKFISRSLKTTFGTINIKSPYCFCPKCKSYFEPYAKVLNIRPGAYQYDLQKNIAKIASSVPFAEAAEIIRDTYGYKITQDTIHQMTNELAAHGRLEELAPVPASIHSVVDEISQGKRQRPVLVFTADGAMAPVRTEKGQPNCWKENKGIRVYLVDDDHIVHIMSWHQICDKEKFIEYLQGIKNLNLFPKAKVRVCCLGDGAGWIWDAFDATFPNARQILDYYHCTEHLHEFASIKFGDSTAGKTWIEKTKKRLFSNDIKYVLTGLKQMKVSGDVEKARDLLYGYLNKNMDRVLYGKARRGGYPIGSGAIESANKFIGHVRLKRSGSWWKINNANNILKLRCGRYNKQFDQFFENYEQAHREPWDPSKPALCVVK
jgi:hypothetical protein